VSLNGMKPRAYNAAVVASEKAALALGEVAGGGRPRKGLAVVPTGIERVALAAIALHRPQVIDGLWLGALTGRRRSDAVGLTWGEVGEHAIVRVAGKKSRGRRRRAVIPLIPETDQLLAELRGRHRLPGVEAVLFYSQGRPSTPGSFTQAFNEARNLAGIVQPADLRLQRPERGQVFPRPARHLRHPPLPMRLYRSRHRKCRGVGRRQRVDDPSNLR